MTAIRVVSFNMQFGQTWVEEDPDTAPVDLDQTIATLRAIDADVVLLQEVEQVNRSAGQINPPPNFSRIRAELPHYDGHFSYPVPDERELPFGYGLGILSRTPLHDPIVVDLPAPDLEFDFFGVRTSPTNRVLIGAKTLLQGREIQILNTHLQAFFIIDHSSDRHPQQRERVASLLRGSRIPTIIGGDFNAAPGEGTIAALEACGYTSAQKEKVTWKRMPYVLDHILFNDQWHLRQVAVIPTAAADHDVLWVDLGLNQ